MLKKLLPLLALVPLTASAWSLDFDATQDTTWNYHFVTYTSSGGILEENKATPKFTISDSILETLANTLPEGHRIDTEYPEYFPTPEPEIIVKKNAEVFVTFYSEGAGYRNALGYYIYDGDTNRARPESLRDIKADGVILFPNTSLAGSGGDLTYGTTVSLGELTVGTKVIFFLVSNGWKGSSTGVRQSDDWIFNSWSPLNKEYDADATALVPDHKHTALLWKNVGPGNILLMGFEDILRTSRSCDHDYNDVLFSVSSSPMDAIGDVVVVKDKEGNTTETEGGFAIAPEERDTDEDGVNDAFDAYIDDPERAYNSYYPSATDKATLAFEDMWPREGDYDMNDMTLSFSVTEVKDASSKVKDIIFTGTVQSYGAGYTNGFAIALDTEVSNIQSAVLQNGAGEVIDMTPLLREDNGSTVITLFSDAEEYMSHYTNVYKEDNYVDANQFILKVMLVNAADVMSPPYNPFLVVTRNHEVNGSYILRDDIEVHLPNYAPTGYAPQSLFHTKDDTSVITEGRTYLTADNKPWGLLIPTTFANPVEQVNIKDAYANYQAWVESQGAEFQDWYKFDKMDAEGKAYADSEMIIKP